MSASSSPPAPFARGERHPWPVLRLGFRPFYLLAAAFVAIAVPLWLGQSFGNAPTPRYLAGAQWHAHEMIFGFACAVIVGFLFTASRNWTGLPTPTGGTLAGLALLWIAGRLLCFVGPSGLAAAVDTAFLPLAGIAVFSVLRRAGSTRNYPIVGLLFLLAAGNAAFHLAVQGRLGMAPELPVRLGLYVIVTIASIIGGRVIPSFTAAALAGTRPRTRPALERAAAIASAAAFALSLTPAPGPVVAIAAAGAAAIHGLRLAGWCSVATRRVPLLLILHVSYAWVPVGFILLALGATGVVSPLAALHAFGMGAVSGLIIGMITRTALGHTGRRLAAGPAETAAYLLVHAAAAVRVAGILWPGPAYAAGLLVSGSLFSIAFLIYLGSYGPCLVSARADGKDG
jgi:uncharacterized protein involved in response to NO